MKSNVKAKKNTTQYKKNKTFVVAETDAAKKQRWKIHCNQCLKKNLPPLLYNLLIKDIQYDFSLKQKKISLTISNQNLKKRLKENYIKDIQSNLRARTPFNQISIIQGNYKSLCANQNQTFTKKLTKKSQKIEIQELLKQQQVFLEEATILDLQKLIDQPVVNAFITATTGNGKSTIAKILADVFPESLNITSEQFIENFVHAAQARDNFSWRKKIRSYPRIIIDDFHYWKSTAKQSQEELIHLIDYFIKHKKSLILLSTQSLRTINISSPLKSRLQVFEEFNISMPQITCRKKILREQCKKYELKISKEVIDYLATRITTNVRSLKIAIKRLKKLPQNSFPLTNRKKLDSHFSDLFCSQYNENSNQLLTAIANFYQIEVEKILGSSREKQTTRARHTIAYICSEFLHMKHRDIAELLQKKQHGTIINACKKMKKLYSEDLFYKDEIKAVLNTLKN